MDKTNCSDLESKSSPKSEALFELENDVRLMRDHLEMVALAVDIAEELYWELSEGEVAEMPSYKEVRKKVTRIKGCLIGGSAEDIQSAIRSNLARLKQSDIYKCES